MADNEDNALPDARQGSEARSEDGTLVDMVGLARENALADAMLTRPGMIKLIAPAKVNLFLGIGGKRADGFHDAANILHAVMLHDTIYMRAVPGKPGGGLDVQVVCTGKGGVDAPDIAPENNIAFRAVHRLAAALGRAEDETVEIVIEKRIPFQAGLGGGSSDAAAVLAGLAELWGVPIGHAGIGSVARELGSDVAFFLQGGCALFDGKGERFVRSIEPRRESVVIVKPDEGLSTAEVYRAFDERSQRIEDDVVARALAADSAARVPLTNNLAEAAERLMPALGRIRRWLEGQQGVSAVLLCGSGSSTFAVCDDFSTACTVAAHAQAQGWWARATAFSGARASVVPSQ